MTATSLIVERVVNGARNVRYEERLPADTEFVIERSDEEGNEHLHFVYGMAEDLEAIGVKVEKKAARKTATKPEAKK